jgi:hypothetical protein
MATITSAATGLWSATGTWVGGVVPVLGDSVVIALGHTVTVDGTYHVGDDTSTALFISGTLRASRVVNSSLTVRGLLSTSATTTATIDYGRASTSDRIPSGITATLVLNSSASMANFKWGLFVADLSNAYFGGAVKSVNTRITSDIPAGGTTCTVSDATGWAVGDKIIMAPSNGTSNAFDDRTISTITPGAGTTATITFPATTFAHGTNCPIGNRTSNVTLRSFNTTNSAYVCFRHSSSASNSRRELNNTVTEYVGSNTAQTGTQVFVSSATSSLSTPFAAVDRCFFYASGQVTGMFLIAWNTGGFELTDLGFFDPFGTGALFYTASGTFVGLKSSVFYHANGIFTSSAFSQGGQGCVYTDVTFCSTQTNLPINHTNGDGALFVRCGFHTSMPGNGMVRVEAGSGQFVNCNFGKLVGTAPCPSLWGTPKLAYVNSTGTPASKGEWAFIDCNFGPPSIAFNVFGALLNPQYRLTVTNKDMDVTAQEVYQPRSTIVRDNGTVNRSRSSIKVRPLIAGTPATRTFSVSAPNNTPCRLVGFLRYDVTYGSATPPSVTLSGLGITPQSYTAGGSANTWYLFDLSATQTSGADGNLTLTLSGQSAATTGFFWLDGIVDAPFVTWTQHYGFTFDPSNPARTVDPVVQLSEAAAAALTGISYAAGTLTISGTRSIREVYDWLKQYEASNRLAPIITSADGVSFVLAADLVLTGTLSGVGALSMPGRTLTASGASSLPIAHAAGVFVSISVLGMVAGSRLQVLNVTTGVELYNDVPGASLLLNVGWTVDQTIRIRVGHTAGATAKMPVEATGLLTAAGASFLVTQVDDAIYNALAIDGSTCTEFTGDYPNLQIDVSDPDLVTTVQRIYAWAAWAQTTADGIRFMFRAVVAQDALNFIIDVGVVPARLDNVTGVPVVVGGGYLARSDGTSVIAPASGSIQMEPGRAYQAPSGVNVVKMNGAPVIGDGSAGNKWRGAGV